MVVIVQTVNTTVTTCNSTVGNCFPYVLLALVSSCASIFGSSVVVYVYSRYQIIRTTSRKLLACISIGDIIVSIGVVINCTTYINEGNAHHVLLASSKVSAVVTSYGIVASSLWTMTLSVYLLLCVVFHQQALADRLTWFYHSVCWTVPVLAVAFPMAFDVVGYDVTVVHTAPVWEWLKSSHVIGTHWAYVMRLAWDLVGYLVCSVIFVVIELHLKNKARSVCTVEANASERSNVSLRYVPLMYVASRIFGTARLFLQTYAPGTDNSQLAAAQAMGDPLQGFINFVIFCLLTKSIRHRLQRRIVRGIVCCVGQRASLRRRSDKLTATISVATLDQRRLMEEYNHFSIQDSDDNQNTTMI